jgi:hypothetical protein
MKKNKAKPAAEAPEAMTLADLREAVAAQNAIIDSAKEKLDGINTELRRRFEAVLRTSLEQQDKLSGQHTFEVDGFKLTGEVKATYKWDSAALEKVARTMPHQTVERLFKIEFSIPEKNYKSITDQPLLDRLDSARTVKYSDPKISFAE